MITYSDSKIGILGTGIYIPEHVITAGEIAEASGIPEHVVRTKLGITQKLVPGEEDHSCAMGIRAAKAALDKTGLDPAEIDLVIYIGEEYKEYPVWTAALKLQHEIGAVNAWGFDAALRCSTTVMALKVAKSMMLGDPAIRTVLLAGGYRNGDLIDYKNPRTRFMFNLSAGGGAVLLRKGLERNLLLESAIMTDGSFSEDVVIPGGGTKRSDDGLERLGFGCFDVPDPEGMKERLEQKSMANFLAVVRSSLERSGYIEQDIDYIGILHMKKSAHDYVLSELGLREDQSIYLSDYGHMGQIDQILSLDLAIKSGQIKPGSVVVLVSAGIGYAWGATTLRWG
ncbi:3-oxoacyl-ACP synthase [Paenibacillus sedimenti]|uniref:3-oxoacyl-ACP synthase n=1 Tax=Paenibacillus sedimenti TaxID=2770274 RepID=A0A926QH04_9BACL|nr:3-oxoacyl-ACP synthase [Paenibacillus sedimenti]MBD0378985.1 3-oxoacyl-ACP synthase [Paenibacillus sedimenti]